MKCIVSRLGVLLMAGAMATTSAQDQCKPIGWATRSGRTGGAVAVTGGGNATPITVKNFADLLKYATDGSPRVIYIDGTLGGGWSGRSGDRLEIKSNKTIIGLRPGTILNAPIHIKDAGNVIVRNLVINGPGSNTDQAWDNINIEGASKNIWIDHCEFWDGQDGNSDAVKGADNITYTWSIFGYKKGGPHNLSNLIASSDDEPVSVNKLNITFMGCWFRGINQRGPRCRYGNIHVANNLYTTDGLASQYAVSAGKDCQVITENNVFVGTSTPIYTGHKAGSSAHYVTGNIFEGTKGNQTGYGSAFPIPYDKSFVIPASSVKAAVQKLAGANLANPTSCGGGATGVAQERNHQSSSRLSLRGDILVAEGFETGNIEFRITNLAGRVLERRILPAVEGASVEFDISSHSGAGVLLASVQVPGETSGASRIKIIR
ncbi:MAG: hypothetical protein H6686_12585 [Fibrobacteria bacterium]|nr:hypothetical protein [Fibrobacteria bacterium]